MNLKPLGDRVIIEVAKEKEKVVGGIVLPGSAKDKPHEGKVVAVGEGARADNGTLIPMTVKAGDNVIYAKFAGSEVKIDDVDYLICKQDDVLAIVE